MSDDARGVDLLTRFVSGDMRARRIVSTPATRRIALRRVVAVGLRGTLLGLHEIPGIMQVRLYEPGETAYRMQPGCIVVACWGGDYEAICAACDSMRPAGIVVVPIVYPAPWWARLEHRAAWLVARVLARRWLR